MGYRKSGLKNFIIFGDHDNGLMGFVRILYTLALSQNVSGKDLALEKPEFTERK
jgi:hypothetical protein